MNADQHEIRTEDKSFRPLLEKDHGYYHSANLTVPVDEVYRACQDKANLEKILKDLPEDVENFLDLAPQRSESLGKNKYKIVWENQKSAKVAGTLTFLLTESIGRPGTWITAEASFEKLNFKTEGPSSLINIFLKRLKALIETGEVPTTKGQPSGREEIKKQQLH